MKIAAFAIGVIVGAVAVVAPVAMSHTLSKVVSQALFDCGIRIAAGAHVGDIRGWKIEGHRYAICIDGGVDFISENLFISLNFTGATK